MSVTRAADPAVPASSLPPKDAGALLSRLGPLPPGCACDIIAQVASALDAAHARGLIHGDVTPANILLKPSDTPGELTPQRIGGYQSGRAYLSDTGMSSALPPGQITATGPPGDLRVTHVYRGGRAREPLVPSPLHRRHPPGSWWGRSLLGPPGHPPPLTVIPPSPPAQPENRWSSCRGVWDWGAQ